MAAHPALSKRPVFEVGDRVVIGFKDGQQKELIAGWSTAAQISV